MATPTALDIQTTIPAFLRKYQIQAPLYGGARFLAPLMQVDYNRAIRGASPAPYNRTPDIARALATGQTQFREEPEGGITGLWDRLTSDIGLLAKSLPHIPRAMWDELFELHKVPEQVQSALREGDLSKIAEAPGIRMLPGAYVAAEGRKALEHPLFAALDVAPYTKGALKGVRIPGTNLIDEATGARIPNTQRVIEGIVPRVNRQLRQRAPEGMYKFDMAKRRMPWSDVARTTAATIAQRNRAMAVELQPYFKKVNDLRREYGIDDETQVGLWQTATSHPNLLDKLEPRQREFMDKIRDETESQAQRLEDIGLVGRREGELYPIADYNDFKRLEDQYWAAAEEGNKVKQNTILDKFEERYRAVPPLRFQPLVRRQFNEELVKLMKSRTPEELWDRYAKYIHGNLWDKVETFSAEEIKNLQAEVTPLWKTMKEDLGLDPLFLHEIAPSELHFLERPTIYPGSHYKYTTLGRDMWEVKPGFENFSVALGYGEYEFVRLKGTQRAITELGEAFGRDRYELQNELWGQAEALAAKTPGLTETAALEQVISKDWVEWHPETIFPFRNPTQKAILTPEKPMYMPKQVAKTIEKTYQGQTAGIQRAWDNTMKVYRTGILPLSPRWHAYNVVGGGVMTAARGGPGMIKHFGDAVRMARGKLPIPEELSRGFLQIPDEAKVLQWGAGKRLGEIIEEKGLFQGGKAAAVKGTTALWNMAEKVDMFYRSVSYLYGTDKAITKGIPRIEAERLGIELANKVLQDWDRMIPFERQVMRSIIPFYGWMKHILQYTTTYPWDHPLRASIISNFARNELADWKSGVPYDFMNYLMFGATDEQGNQTGFNLRGANPFSDVSSYFTVGGLISQLNPIAGGLLEAAGLDPMSGRPQAFGDVDYNPSSGRLEVKQPSLLEAAGQTALDFVPQNQAIRELFGIRFKTEKEFALSNPDAYRSSVMSSLGVPLPRTVNKQYALAQSELRRSDDMQEAWTKALKTGDFSEVKRYPRLRPLIAEAERQLASGALDQLAIQSPPTGVLSPSEMVSRLGGR